MLSTTTTTKPNYQILWEKLPDDYILPNDPVDNINQPPLAAAQLRAMGIEPELD